MFLRFGYLYKFVMFYVFFVFKKQKIIDLKKTSQQKFRNSIFLFLLKVRLVGPADQQINLVSPQNLFTYSQLASLLSNLFLYSRNKLSRKQPRPGILAHLKKASQNCKPGSLFSRFCGFPSFNRYVGQLIFSFTELVT